jgi:hypothetical protein
MKPMTGWRNSTSLKLCRLSGFGFKVDTSPTVRYLPDAGGQAQ